MQPVVKQVLKKNPLMKKKNMENFNFDLNINTDEINEIYTCGGEKGKKIIQ